MCRSGRPAWYCRQSQMENGDSRSSCHDTVRSQNVDAACSGFGSRKRTENATSVASAKPATNRSLSRPKRRASGYESQSGATSRLANFVQPDNAAEAPRASGHVTRIRPRMRKKGGIASFVFELETYCVNGYAAQATAKVAARRV